MPRNTPSQQPEAGVKMLLYIVRHGETRLNIEKCTQGWIDEPLNENGRALASVTGQGLKDIKFDAAISSPLSRAYDTAKLILAENEHCADLEIKTDRRLMELNWGSWDALGCSPSNMQVPTDSFNLFYEKPFEFVNAPDGESIRQLCDRLEGFYKELVATAEYEDKTLLLSMHGCSMRALLHQVYEDKNDFWHGRVPYNCAVNIVEITNGEAKLLADDKVYYDESLAVDNYAMDQDT